MNRAEHPHCSIAPKLTFAASGLCLLDQKNDQRVMGIILRCVCWGTHQTPWGARRLASRPPPPLDPQKFSHPLGVSNSNKPPPLPKSQTFFMDARIGAGGGVAPILCRSCRS